MASNAEGAILEKDRSAIFSVFDHQRLGPQLQNLLRGARQAGIFGQHLGFSIVDQQCINGLEHLSEFLRFAGDPEIHGVAADELGSIHLLAHVDLKNRIDIGQEKILALPVLQGYLRIERGEDAKLSIERFGFIHVLAVLACPEEALAVLADNTADVDAMRAKHLLFFFAEVGANNADHLNVSKKTSRQREISGGASQDSIYFAVGSLDCVKSNRTNDQK